MWAILSVKPLAAGITGQVFLIFPPWSLRALFQGFCILTLISTLGSWGYPPNVDFGTCWQKNSPLVFACLISRLLDSHPHIYLGPMGLSPSCRVVGKNAYVLCFLCCGLYPRPHKIWHSTNFFWHWPKIKTQSCQN